VVVSNSALVVSCNEIEGLAQKAARGGGAYPAQAAHFGRAVVCHLAAGRDAGPVIEALRALPGGVIQTSPLVPCGGSLGESYGDALACGDARPTRPARLACPNALHDLLLAFAARTYVPSSQSPRAAGAGAGLTDTD